MDTSIIVVSFLAVIGLAWLYLQWQSKDEAGRRAFVADMVKYAQMKLTDKPGRERFEYVMGVLKVRYPKVPVDWLETAIESALFDAKAQAGQIPPPPKPEPKPVERTDAPRWRN